MKKPTFAHDLAVVLFALLLTVFNSAYASIVVQSSATSPLPMTDCTTAKITTTMTYNGDGLGGSGTTGPNEFHQMFLPGTTITIDLQQNSIQTGLVSVFIPPSDPQGYVFVKYTIATPNTAIPVEIKVTTSCAFTVDLYTFYGAGAYPDVAGGPLVLHPANTALTVAGGYVPAYPVHSSTMHIMNFKDDVGYVGAGTLYPYYPPTQKLLVSENLHTRQYDLYVSDGKVESLVFNYTPASNFKPISFRLQGMHNNSPASSTTVLVSYSAGFLANNSGTFAYSIDAATIGTLFANSGYKMTQLDSIRVIETFQVIACSPSTIVPDRSRYSITWNGCPQTPCILPGADGILDSPPLGDDVVSGLVITPAADGILHSTPLAGSDDVIIGKVITAGADGVLQTPNPLPWQWDVRSEAMITPGPNGILNTPSTAVIPDDVFIPGVMITAGLDGRLDTPPSAGDVLSIAMISAGPLDSILYTAPDANDVISGGMISAGPDGILQTTPIGGDQLSHVIMQSANGVCDSYAVIPTDDQQIIRAHESGFSSCGNSTSAERFSSVVASQGGITPSIHFENPPGTIADLDFCPGQPSDIVISFKNAKYDESGTFAGPYLPGHDNIAGSDMKTLHTITFPMKQDVFSSAIANGGAYPPGDIYLEGTGVSAPVSLASFPPGFYTYTGQMGNPPYQVILNFDLLTGSYQQVLGSGGPLENGFIHEGVGVSSQDIYNEIDDSKVISIRFKNAVYDCVDARFYLDPPGFLWGDYPKPSKGFMFIGDGNDTFDFNYADMCGGPGTLQQQHYNFGNFHYDFPVRVAEGADRTTTSNNRPLGGRDMEPGDKALIDFQYAYAGTEPNPSPFAFDTPSSQAPYFDCVPKYQSKLYIPVAYSLLRATYYVDPHRTPAGAPGNLWTATSATTGISDYTSVFTPNVTINGKDYNCYTFTGVLNSQSPELTLKGHIAAEVILNPCQDADLPESHGGLDRFTATIQAFCGDCSGCPNTIAVISSDLAKHCNGSCGGGVEPQQTTSFSYKRHSFGWDPTQLPNLVPVVAGSGIVPDRAYPCDQMEFVATGTFLPATDATLSFRLEYFPGANALAPINFQFYEFEPVGSTVTCQISGTTYTYYINPLTDLATTFMSPLSTATPNAWVFNGSFTGTVTPCDLFLNFRDTANTANDAFFDALHGVYGSALADLEMHVYVKIKQMGNGFVPGDFPLTIQGQFWGDPSGGAASTGYKSCDPYWSFMEVLGVTNTPYATIHALQGGEVCNRSFEFGVRFDGGFDGGLAEFENELRPQVFWPDEAAMQLPPGVHHNAAHANAATFTVLGNSLYPQPGPVDTGFPVNLSIVAGSGITGDTITFKGFNSGIHNWPLIGKDGESKGLRIYGWLRNDCAITDPGLTVGLDWPFIGQYYTADPGCAKFNTAQIALNYPPVSPVPDISLAFDPAHSVVTTIPATLSDLQFTYTGLPGTTLEHTYIKFKSPDFVVTSITLNGSQTINAIGDGYYLLGTIAEGDVNAAHIALNGVTFPNCVAPGIPITLDVEYGYACFSDPPSAVGGSATFSPCLSHHYPLTVTLAKSGLNIEVFPPAVTTGSACDEFEYQVRLTSTDFGDVRDPKVSVTLPAGMTITRAKYSRTDGNPTAVTSCTDLTHNSCPDLINVTPALNNLGGTFTWNLKPDAYPSIAGIPGAGAYIDLFFKVRGSCVTTPSLFFSASGKGLCPNTTPLSAVVNNPDFQLQLTLGTITPTITCPPDVNNLPCGASSDPLTLGMATATDNCGQPVPSPSISYHDTITSCAGGIDRKWTAKVCGPDLECHQYITFVDTTPPTVTTAVGSLSQTLPCGDFAGITAALALEPTAIDTCGTIPSLITAGANAVLDSVQAGDDVLLAGVIRAGPNGILDTPVSGDDVASPAELVSDQTIYDSQCASAYVRVRKWQFTDACGNPSAVFEQTIMVQNTPLVVACPPDKTVCDSTEAPIANNLFQFQAQQGSVSGGCGSVTVTHLDDTISGNCPTYTIIRRYQVADSCKDSICTQTITVSPPSTYTVNLQPGFNLVAIQLAIGANNLNDLFANLPDGAAIYKFVPCSGNLICYIKDTISSTGWLDCNSSDVVPGTVEPGEGVFINQNWSGSSVPLTFTGTPICPDLPVQFACPCGTFELLSRQVPCPGTYENITGLSPQEGTSLNRWNGTGYDIYTFHQSGGWTPPLTPIAVGEAVFISAPCCSNPPPDLTLWLPLDEPSGTTSANLASDSNPGTQNGPSVGNGYVLRSLCFDGVNDSVSVPHYPAINPRTGGLTIDAWVKRDPASGNSPPRIIVDKRSTTPDIVGYSLAIESGKLLFQLADAPAVASTDYRDTGTVPADNQWHFVAVTLNRNSTTGGRFYIDGQPTGTFDPTAFLGRDINPPVPFLVGNTPVSAAAPWMGCIDEVEYFTNALTAQDILAIFSSGSAGKCKPACTNGLVLSGCTSLTSNCTSDAGAVINYACPTANSPCCSGPVTITCSPPPGPFPIGVTTVVVGATDSCGNSNYCTFTVTVVGHGAEVWSWRRRAGNVGADAGNAVAVDKNANVFVTGAFQGTMNFGLPNPNGVPALSGFGEKDIFLAKYDPAGVVQWAVRAGSATNDTGFGVTVDDQGNAYITGEFMGTTPSPAHFESYPSIAAFTMTSSGGRDIFVAKYNPSGVCQWVAKAGETGDDSGAGIAWTAMGDKVFVTGQWGPGPTLNPFPNRQAFIFPVTSAGAMGAPVLSLPTISADLSQFAVGRAVAVDGSGNAYMVGDYRGTISATRFPGATSRIAQAINGGFQQIFAVKYDNNLTTCLAERDSSFTTPGTSVTGHSVAAGIALDPTSTYCYVAGASFFGVNGIPATVNFGLNTFVTNLKNFFPPGQLNDHFIVKLDTSLAPIWAVIGDSGISAPNSNDETRGITVDPDGNPVVTGFRHPNATTPFVNEGPTVLVASYDRVTHALRWIHNAVDGPNLPNMPLDIGFGIAVSREGCVHITGKFTEDVIFPPLVPFGTLPVLDDMFVAKMCPLCDCYPLVVWSTSDLASGVWVVETGAVVDQAAMTVTVSQMGTPRLYKIESPCLSKVIKIVVSGSNVVMTYTFQ